MWRGSTGLEEAVKGPGVRAGMSVRREDRAVESSRGGGGIAGEAESVMMERRWAWFSKLGERWSRDLMES